MIILDTNVVSERYRRSPDERVVAWILANGHQNAITTITAAEMYFGAQRLSDRRRRERLLDTLDEMFMDVSAIGRLIAFGHEDAMAFGELRARCEASGRPRPHDDLMIAAICKARKAPIATRDVKHFEGLGIEVIDPWAG
jgi:predicted nucleic acid-binding protein